MRDTKWMMVWGPAAPAVTQLDLDLVAYERYVEAPRRHSVDPVWESLLAEALDHSATAAEAA